MKQRMIGDDIAVIECSGRIVEGAETTALDKQVRDQQVVYRYFVLDLHDVAFVDSAGLGLLVRLLSRLRRASGDLKLCGVAANIQKSLNVSRLSSVLPSYDGVAEAVAAFERPSGGGEAPARDQVDILCVHRSNDVLA